MRIRGLKLLAGALTVLATAGYGQGNMVRSKDAAVPVLNRFVKVDALDFKTIVPAPPATGSAAAQAEIQTLLHVQAWRNAEQIAWARVAETESVYSYAEILGSWFKADRLPQTAVFFKLLADDLRALDSLAKKPFARARPSVVEPRIKPGVTLPATSSYPSGSATQALVWAELLAEVFPAKKTELMERASKVGWGRVIGGVHYPSDLVAGQILGRAFLAECKKSRIFREAFAASRQELLAANPGK